MNKTTLAAKEAFRMAFEGTGGVPALIAWGKENRGELYKLYARLIPTEVTGKDGGAIQLQHLDDAQINARLAVLMADEKLMQSITTTRKSK